MAIQVKDSTYRDSNGKQILWDDSVKKVVFYSSTGESWDRTGGGNASWYLENTLPYDSFDEGSLSEDKWSFFSYRGTVSGTVADKLFLTISGSDARGGITSEGKWKLTGDFDIRLYLDESAYYNEYRSSAATGLTISVDEANKYRVSKYFNKDTATIGYSADYVDSFALKFALWTQDGFSTSVGEPSVTVLRLVRAGGVLSAYVSSSSGFVQLGSDKEGGSWSEDVDVEIEIETEQYNYYSADILAFSVSGTLASLQDFSSSYRGPSSTFPERSLLLVDSEGLSIVDDDDLSLWMRFKNSPDYMFKDTDCNIAASEGKIYYTSSSGIVCFDFPNDKAVWYTDSEKRESTVGLAVRNFKNSFATVSGSSLLLENTATDVAAASFNGVSFMAAATTSGLGLLIGDVEKVEAIPSGYIREVKFGDDSSLYWSSYDPITSRGKLYFRDSVNSLVGDVSTTFSYTNFYSSDTTPSLSSEYVNDISILTGDARRVVVSNRFGMDYITLGDIISFGPRYKDNPIKDPDFSSEVGVYWVPVQQSVFSSFDIGLSSDWYSSGSTSLFLGLQESKFVSQGNYGGVSQQIDLTNVDQLYFDFYVVSNPITIGDSFLNLEVRVDGQVMFVQNDLSGSFVKLDNSIDVSSLSGSKTVMFVVTSQYTGSTVDYTSFYVDNLRVVPVASDYPIIPSATHEILEALLVHNSVERKIFFSTKDGYGSIDLDSRSLDYFVSIEGVLPLSYVVSADYVEYVDAV